jgi:CHAD domain-containing protein
MTAKLQAHGSATRQARRILRSQTHNALKKLDGNHTSSEDLHAARRNIKKARATLRLLREALPRSAYRRENRTLRNAARPLSAARDKKILVETCDRVRQRYRAARHIGGVLRLRRSLVRARNEARRRALNGAAGLRQSRKLLRQARQTAAAWSLGHEGWTELVQGASRVYCAGRAALEEARRDPSIEHLHEWRKQAKYLHYQLELLRPLCGAEVGRVSAGLHALSDDLGDDHDLAVLRASAATHSADFARQAGLTAFITLIERARTALQRKALLRGARVYRREPADFVRQLNGAPGSRFRAAGAGTEP